MEYTAPTSALQPMSVTLPLVSPESDFIGAICRAAKAPIHGELSNALSGARGQLAALVAESEAALAPFGTRATTLVTAAKFIAYRSS